MAAMGRPGPEEVKDSFLTFLTTFVSDSADDTVSQASADDGLPGSQPQRKYVNSVREMDTQTGTTLYVDWDHLNEYDPELADVIKNAHLYYEAPLRQAVQTLVATYAPEKLEQDDRRPREFFCSFYNLQSQERMRNLKSQYIGKLVAFSGTVTRTSEVRPELFLATFKCPACGTVAKNVQQQFRYTEPLVCSSKACGNTGAWQLIKEECVFVDWQKACVQEAPNEVPGGCLPRTMDVILRHDMCEKVRPGDKVVFAGDVIVVPDVSVFNAPGDKVTSTKKAANSKPLATVAGTESGVAGFRGLGVKELNYRLAFLASSVVTADNRAGVVNIRGDDYASSDEVLAEFTEEQVEDLAAMINDTNIYRQLARSIAPAVFGHEDIKRAILLMLFGGVHKTTKEGINLRGDINVAIVGDPSCGKSQMLKYVSTFLPRAVYTSGKSSSAAGLTATVARDNDTNEYCIEAGALMLADNGICCIDEFDKMDSKDQVAIHEAMEQQTISISKAGIQATLNARTSILAAANPLGGRYDKAKPLKANVMLPPAILSRFDLLHIMIDDPNDAHDFQVASHIVSLHCDGHRGFDVPYEMDKIQRYIKYARAIKPEITAEAKKVLVESYKRLRSDDAVPGSNTSYRITVRQLEALVRLSQALARVRCTTKVLPQHVKEAARLLKNSIIAVEPPDVQLEGEVLGMDHDEADMEDDAGVIAQELMQQARGGAAGGLHASTSAADAATAGAGQQQQQGGGGTEQGGSNDMEIDENAQPNVQQGQQQPAAAAKAKPSAQAISQKKYNQIKNLLVMKLDEVEQQQQEGGGEPEGVVLGPGGSKVAGMRQHDLIKWFVEYQTERGALSSTEGLLQEIVLVEKVVQRLVRRDQVLVVVEEPTRQEAEAADEYLRRVQAERVLAISPNYVPE